jgi:UDP-glucose 4-epimerase
MAPRGGQRNALCLLGIHRIGFWDCARGTQAGIINTPSTVLVTGGAGFVGSHLVADLIAREAHVTVVDNLSTGRVEHLESVWSKIELCQGDLGDLLHARQISVDDYDIIFHLAANAYIPPSIENPSQDFNANAYNTFVLLEQLRASPQPPRLVNVSSAAVYGNPARLPIRESDPTIPISPYGVSKLAAERYVAVYSQLYGLQASSVRFFSVYGPRQRKQVVYDVLLKLRLNPARLEVLGDGSQARDLTFVGDIVKALVLVAQQAPGRGEVFNVASGATHTIAELIQIWCEVLSLMPEIVYSGQTRPGDAERWVVDISELQRLGYAPQTSLREGLAAVRDWYDADGA